MKCSFCDHVLTPEMLRTKGCGVCIGGCRKIHCPYCGQENPIVPEVFDKWFKDSRKTGKKGDTE